MDWLKDAIILYIQKGQYDSIDICSHFKLRVDVTLSAIDELVNEGRIIRRNHLADGWNGNHHYEIAPSGDQLKKISEINDRFESMGIYGFRRWINTEIIKSIAEELKSSPLNIIQNK